jgi:hypothetical protein
MVCFEHLSGMRINYHKSDMIPINLEEEEAFNFAKIFFVVKLALSLLNT